MARVIAFSCAHVCTPETCAMLFGASAPDGAPLEAFAQRTLEDMPDVLVCLGDLWEAYYDPPDIWQTLAPSLAELLAQPGVVRLAGNHDPGSLIHVEIDGVRYEHGHHGLRPSDTPHMRAAHRGKRMVHGHTHEPQEGWPLDVGSLRFTGTYGEIIDGVARLRRV